MGKRSAVVELFLGDMGSIQRELRPSIQREDQLTMETKLEQIAVKARREPNLRFAHLKRILRLGRLRLRGPRGAQDEFVLAAIAQNLRRLASLVARSPPSAVQCIA